MLSFLALNWRWLTSAILSAAAVSLFFLWRTEVLETKHTTESANIRIAERDQCKKAAAITKGLSDDNRKKGDAACNRASGLVDRVYATCGTLSVPTDQANGFDSRSGRFCMDRAAMADFINTVAKPCAVVRDAAITLDNAWK